MNVDADPDPGDVIGVSDDGTITVFVTTDPNVEPHTYDDVRGMYGGWLVAVALGETWFRHKGEKWAYAGTNGHVQFERDDGVIPDLEDELGGVTLDDFGAMVESGELEPARPPDLPHYDPGAKPVRQRRREAHEAAVRRNAGE